MGVPDGHRMKPSARLRVGVHASVAKPARSGLVGHGFGVGLVGVSFDTSYGRNNPCAEGVKPVPAWACPRGTR